MTLEQSPRREKIVRAMEKGQLYVVSFVLTPLYYLVHMIVVRPQLAAAYHAGPIKHCLHVCLSTFCFINVFGNMLMSLYSMVKPPDLAADSKDGVYCENCKEFRPVKSWHCRVCNTCIAARDHHCFFFATCIGQHNHRYYLLYLVYMNISILYAMYYELYYIMLFDTSFFDLLSAAIGFFNPSFFIVVKNMMLFEDVFCFIFVTNFGLLIWFATLLRFHLQNAMRGVTSRESIRGDKGDISKWKENLLRVFGERWYLAIICPFVRSDIQ